MELTGHCSSGPWHPIRDGPGGLEPASDRRGSPSPRWQAVAEREIVHSKKLTIDDLTEIGERVVDLAKSYKIKRKSEFFYDALLCGYLAASYPSVSRQMRIYRRHQAHPLRIDFRVGGTNPTVLELAVRYANGAGLFAQANTDELQKLTRLKKPKTRFLLLLDPTTCMPLSRESLEEEYERVNRGPGRFQAQPVRVVYARAGHSFNFGWSP